MNKLIVVYGTKPQEMVRPALDRLKVKDSLSPNARIGIKPNLVVEKPSSSGATTTPELVEAIIVYLQEAGCRDITILESSAIGHSTKRAFSVCGYEELASRYGVKLIDLKHDRTQTIKVQGLDLCVAGRALGFDYLINVPVLKAHCQTQLTCALKNLKGCLPDDEKRRFHRLGLHRPIALLNTVVRSSLVVVDALCGDLTFEEGGNPVPMNRIFVAYDPVLADAYAAELLGYEPRSIAYIRLAEELGVGSADLTRAEIIELQAGERTPALPPVSPLALELGRWVEERAACSICYGNLLHALARLKENGSLAALPEKIKIGQGFKGEVGSGVGVGSCTVGLTHNLPGCPPRTREMALFLESLTRIRKGN
ncbi:MAG: hypothetical protein PWQ41_56 [Bacillota bacterium]|nr:hypothetical protein [Bacillota bacterium]MDK2924282.1 hypothetical protein [Bacillota bacterium]